MQNKANLLSSFTLLCALFLQPCVARAQTSGAVPLITEPVDEANLIVLHGNTHPLALPKYDRGVAPSNLPMQRMLLVLQRSPAQESALEQLLEQQQDNSSANYHQWLTPQEYGLTFGPADQDIQTITTWLQSHGFQVNRVSSGRVAIDFSGTAGQVAEAFHTTIHKYVVNGEEHWANASDPQIPAALAPAVAGVRSLHNFFPKPMNSYAGTFTKDKNTGKVTAVKSAIKPLYTFGGTCGILGGTCEALGPYDLATIYNVLPLWNSTTPIDGTGQTIAIVGETDIDAEDWTSFWNMFGVTTPKGTLNIIYNGPNPGRTGDEPEADIDTQWSSAVARGATIDFVVSESTETTAGIDLSAEYIIDNNLAPVMSESYGECELFLGTSGNAYYNSLWQQASAQGITVFLSSGDQGSAVCDDGAAYAEYGLAVSGLGSTPYNVAVGGTDFNDLTTTGNYWNFNNNANQANAKGYIPEMTWNDTCTNSEIFPYLYDSTAEQTCNDPNAQYDGFLSVTGGSGGASNCINSNGQVPSSCTVGYAKPPWQAGTGVPGDGKRDVPDVSLFASNGFNNSFYIICQSDAAAPCGLSNFGFQGYGGTSVSSPAFAGIMALVNQKTGQRQGNANYVFYKMAAGTGTSCNSSTVSSTGTNNCIFYDIPTGSTIAMPCAAGSPNCTTTNPGDEFGVLSGFNTGTGYDLATGLGSVNVTNLVNQWSTYAGQFKATTISPFTLGPPTTITHGQSVPVAATVKPQTGTGTPTGTITLIANTGSSASAQTGVQQTFTLSNGSVPAGSNTILLPGGTNYTVTAHYSGDGTFAASVSSPANVTVNPETSKSQAAIVTFDPNTGQITSSNSTSFPYGSFYLLRASAMNSSGNPCAPNGIQQYGCPTGTFSLTDSLNGGAPAPIDLGTYTLNSEGYAEDQAVFLLGGQNSIVASYSGDNSYNPSSNAATPDVVTVSKAATTISLAGGGQYIVGGYVSVTATVSTQVFVPALAPLTDYPTGTVQFFAGSVPITGQITPVAGPGPYGDAQLTATFHTNTLPAGTTTITAQYPGDSNYGQSAVSNPVTVQVLIATTTILNTSNSNVPHGTPVTFTAQIIPQQSSGPAITGTVQFSINCSGCNPIGSAAVISGQAQITTSTLPGGTYQVVANYSGDTNYEGAIGVVTQTVGFISTTTTVTSPTSTIQQGSSVTFTAQIVPGQSGGPLMTGTVQFLANGSSLGFPTVSNNQAQFTTNSLPAGTDSITANYSGDSNYAPSSGTFTETVTAAPTFGVSANPASVPVTSPGASGTATLTFTGMNGYSGTIPLSASLCSGMPSETTCSFSTASVVLNGSATTATAMVTFQTTAASAALPQSNKRPANFGWWTLGGSAAIAGFIFCLGIMLAGYRSGRLRLSSALALLAITSLLAMASCNSGGGTTGPPPNGGTPVGLDQNVVITFNGAGVTPSPTLTLSVNVE